MQKPAGSMLNRILLLLALIGFLSCNAVLAQQRLATPKPSAKKKAPAKKPPQPGDIPDLGHPKTINLRADRIRHEGNVTIAEGHVIAISEGIRLEGNRIRIDKDKNIATVTGNARVQQGGDEIIADRVVYDLKSGVADMDNVFGIARNLALKRQPIRSEMFFWAPRAQWNGQVIRLLKGVVSTCDIPPPGWHYHATGDVILIYPQDRVEVHKARLYVGDTEILGRQLVVFSLKQVPDSQLLFPRVNRNPTDGFVVQVPFRYRLFGSDLGLLHLDYLQKNHFARGIDQSYQLSDKGAGNFSFYDLANPPHGVHRYNLRDTTRYNFAPNFYAVFQYVANQYTTPQDRLVSPASNYGSLTLTESGPRSVWSLSSGFYSAAQTQFSSQGLLYRDTLSESLSNHFEAQYSRSSSIGTTTTYLHALDRLSYRGDLFDSDTLVEDTTGKTAFVVNRLPEVTMRSHALALGDVPVKVALGVSNVQEEPSGITAGRGDLQLVVPDAMVPLGDSGRLQLGAGLRQLFYSNGDAQYTTAARAGWVEDLGQNVRMRFDYRYQHSNGFVPLQSDVPVQYNAVSGGLELHRNDWLNVSVDAGRDLQFGRYYDMISRIDIKPAQGWRFNIGTDYDPNFGRLMHVDSLVKLPITPTLSVQHYALYDTLNKRLTYHDLMLQHESHDWLTSIIYRGVQNQIWLQVELKAFPFQLPTVGPDNRNPIIPSYRSRGII